MTTIAQTALLMDRLTRLDEVVLDGRSSATIQA